MAVCVLIADLGDQYNEKFKNVQRKVVFSFDIPSETVVYEGEERPRQLSKWYTFSTNKKSGLYKALNAWLNTNMSEDELSEIDLFSLIGQGCQVQVTASDDGSHNNIQNIMALPKGTPAPVSDTPTVTYDIDEDWFTGEKWEGLPEWVKNAVMKSEQYQQNPPDKALDMPPAPPSKTEDDKAGADIDKQKASDFKEVPF